MVENGEMPENCVLNILTFCDYTQQTTAERQIISQDVEAFCTELVLSESNLSEDFGSIVYLIYYNNYL